jgi:hypothetical protein
VDIVARTMTITWGRLKREDFSSVYFDAHQRVLMLLQQGDAAAISTDHARELLWTAPCDLTAAADAVNRFQQAVLAVGAQRL